MAASLLLSCPLESSRDIIQARQLARQIAGLLGFAPPERTCIAGAAFEVAASAFEQRGRCSLQFLVENGQLIVGSNQPRGQRLVKALPDHGPAVPAEDLCFVTRQLADQTPAALFEEFQAMNRELLFALAELSSCRAELARQQPAKLQPVAA